MFFRSLIHKANRPPTPDPIQKVEGFYLILNVSLTLLALIGVCGDVHEYLNFSMLGLLNSQVMVLILG